MGRMGKIYIPKPIPIKSRKELLAGVKPQHQRHLREDNGDLPEHFAAAAAQPQYASLPIL